MDGSDEKNCFASWDEDMIFSTSPPPAIVFSTQDGLTVYPLDSTNITCPDTHFLCPGEGYCLPVYARCNSVYDCPGREDENRCDSYTCLGFFRCRNSPVCVHADHVCDGVFQCPEHDDELACGLTCPDKCQCQGYAFVCAGKFPAEDYPELRYLNADGSGIKLQDVSNNRLLIHLDLKNCGISDFDVVHLPNLRSLDLSSNILTNVTALQLEYLHNLQYLSIASNNILFSSSGSENTSVPNILHLDISDIHMLEISDTLLHPFSNIQHLNLSGNKISKVSPQGFSRLYQLRVLDLSGSPMTYFSRDVFRDLGNVKRIFVDNYKLCCPAILPEGFSPENCRAPADEISSCDALLKTDVFRIFLAVYAFLALVGNLASFVYRVYCERGAKKQLGFDVFVTHLCVSDFLMGEYLTIIGVADRWYYGSYEWNERKWIQSSACQLAGFLCLLSSEVSAFFICFITLERFLFIRFPLHNFRFSVKSAQVLSVAGWVVGVVLATVPLLPSTEHWQFYSQTGICIPLPITRKKFPGSDYSFYVMIVFNFVLFLLIAIGQLLIFWSYHSHGKTVSRRNKKPEDLAVARRLLVVAMSDFLCWFPLGLLGLMARSGIAIPGSVNVAMAIFILPFNSAINPFLYTLHSAKEHFRQYRRERDSETRPSKEVVSVTCQTTFISTSIGCIDKDSSVCANRAEKGIQTEIDVTDVNYTPGKAQELLVTGEVCRKV